MRYLIEGVLHPEKQRALITPGAPRDLLPTAAHEVEQKPCEPKEKPDVRFKIG